VSVEVDNDLRRAESLIEINRPNDALPILSAIIAMHPDNVKAYCLLARCHSLNGGYGAMLTAASNAVMYGPQQEWGFRLQSMALRNLGRTDEAVAAATVAVRLAPNLWQPYVNLVEALLKSPEREQRRQAYAAAKTAVALAPATSSTHITLGRVYMSIGERDAARACFERALALSPADATAHTNLAILDLNRGRVTAAGQGFGNVAASNPGNRAYVNNVSVAAGHWYARALDVGTFICFGQILLDVFLPRPLGGQLALALTAAYLLATSVLFVRLPRPLRILVGRHVRGRDHAASLLFLLFLALITWASVGDVFIRSTVRPAGSEDVVLLGLMMVIRFRVRFQRWAQPYLLRRRYRTYVLGGDALVPRQRPSTPEAR
jgi:tetratricopeptide (TPR) repeat protein